jgi:hypothetical protein
MTQNGENYAKIKGTHHNHQSVVKMLAKFIRGGI